MNVGGSFACKLGSGVQMGIILPLAVTPFVVVVFHACCQDIERCDFSLVGSYKGILACDGFLVL